MLYLMNNKSYTNGRRYSVMFAGSYTFKESWHTRHRWCLMRHALPYNYSMISNWSAYYDR